MINETSLEKWVRWNWFDGSTELDAMSEEHIWDLMKEGYTSGELNKEVNGEIVRGWWKKK